MAIQTINIGAVPNDGTGDPARTAFDKHNQNFTDSTNAAAKLVQTSPVDTTTDRVVKTDSLGDNSGPIWTNGALNPVDYKAGAPVGGDTRLAISPTGTPRIDIANAGVGGFGMINFLNTNGNVGSIVTSGFATAYNTSSDPRLKDFKPRPDDQSIDSKFSDLVEASAFFTWKGGDESLIWGFDAHKCIDLGLDIGSEGDGPRSLPLGDIFNSEGEDKVVTPAGVDQSKAVPILLAKIEKMDREIKALKEKIK